MRYRSEIDGLRAFAVVPVVLYHAGFAAFAGGFVGVDIFFVISGYLITTIIVEEAADGRFSISRFYERRARRILPALYLVIAVSTVAAWALMMPDQIREYSRAMLSVFGLASNMHFWLTTSYFQPGADELPLLHTWSLSVEEQYYLAFPLVLIQLWRSGAKATGAVIGLVTLGSFALCEIVWRGYPAAGFYLLPTRAWELGLGSLAAIHLVRRRWVPSATTSQMASLLGLLLMAFSVAAYSDATPFPGGFALAPTLGAVLVILFAAPGTLVGGLLSMRPVVWVGLVSYSAYLWHQPLFVFARIATPVRPSGSMMLAAAAATFLLAGLTWACVERPFRDRARIGRQAVLRFGVAGGALLVGVGLLLPLLAPRPGAYAPEFRQLFVSRAERSDYVKENYRSLRAHAEAGDERPVMLLIGDSYSQDFLNMVREVGAFLGHRIVAHYIPARCQVYFGGEDVGRFVTAARRGECRKLRGSHATDLARRANVIVLAARWSAWAAERLPETIRALDLRPEQRILVIGGKSFGRPNLRAMLRRNGDLAGFRLAPEAGQAMANQRLRTMLPPALFVDTHAIVCGVEVPGCPLFTPSGSLISYDGFHLTQAGARYVGTLLFRDPALAGYAPKPPATEHAAARPGTGSGSR
jgi:peptidoglycan/LPS O-acetylase OafA/YrhL